MSSTPIQTEYGVANSSSSVAMAASIPQWLHQSPETIYMIDPNKRDISARDKRLETILFLDATSIPKRFYSLVSRCREQGFKSLLHKKIGHGMGTRTPTIFCVQSQTRCSAKTTKSAWTKQCHVYVPTNLDTLETQVR